ncbi:MAG: hypothetical protein KAU22_02425 [Desulfuromonadales bacterium]|nr:hypothetical protein [Desulfuromonadales bacterium]
MKYTLKIGLLGILLLSISSIAMAIKIEGTVVKTNGLDVTVKATGKNIPVPGDLMEISFSIPGGDTLSIGTWKVTNVSGSLVSASVVRNTGTPSKGQQAVIISKNPVQVKVVKRNQPPSSPKRTTPQVLPANTTPEARNIIALLQSSTAAEKRNGAKKAYKRFAHDPAVLAIVADELNKGYAVKTRDKYHPDAMAWLCNVLGASKDIKYKDLLKTVYRKCPSKKVRKYAKKNLRLLR